METSNKFLEEDELKAALDWLTADVLCCEKKKSRRKNIINNHFNRFPRPSGNTSKSHVLHGFQKGLRLRLGSAREMVGRCQSRRSVGSR